MYGKDSYTVFANSRIISKDETLTIPVEIKNNEGLMGFRISVAYPKEAFDIVNVSSASVTKNGSFNTTIKEYSKLDGFFDVVWSNSEETKSDGALFLITCKAKKGAANKDYIFNLKYSTQDTFNEQYEDVALLCNSFTVTVENDNKVKNKSETKQTVNSNSKSLSDDYLLFSVSETVKQLGASSISELNGEQQRKLVSEVNKKIQTSGFSKQYSSFEALETEYTSVAQKSVVSKIKDAPYPKELYGEIKSILKKHHANSFNELSEAEKEEAINELLKYLNGANSGTQPDYMVSYETLANCIDKTVKEEKLNNYEKKGNMGVVIPVIVISVALIMALIFVLLKKRKQNNN